MIDSRDTAKAPPGVAAKPWLKDDIPDLSKAGEDAFAVDRLVDGLLDLVRQSDPPFVLSLSGAWGVGKSTIADNLRRRLERDGGLVAYIDAWTTDLDNLRRTLTIEAGAALRGRPADERGLDREAIAELLDASIRDDSSATETQLRQVPIKEVLSTLVHSPILLWFAGLGLLMLWVVFNTDPTSAEGRLNVVLGTISGGLLTVAIVGSGLFVRTTTNTTRRAAARESVVYAETFADVVTGREADLAREKDLVGKTIRDITEWLAALAGRPRLVPTAQTALVIVDNLDRLSSGDALTALAQIRALVEIPGSRCLFLIPVDRRALARHLTGALATGTDETSSATDYLGKFFNLDLVLTEPEAVDLRDWALRQIERAMPDIGADPRSSMAQIVASAAGSSPRTVRRIINGVSSRYRLLDPGLKGKVTAVQLAFVEGLLVAFPDLLPGLVSEPRDFVDMRAAIPSDGDDDLPNLIALFTPRPEAARTDALVSALVSYLRRNGSVELDAGVLRGALSLRPNRFWKRVTDPEPFVRTMSEGQGQAFGAAVNDLSAAEKPFAIASAIEVLETDLPTYPRDAIEHLNAIASSVRTDTSSTKRIGTLTALESTILRASDAEFARLGLDSVDLLAEAFPASRLSRLAGRLASQLEAIRQKGEDVDLTLQMVCRVSDRLAGDALASARRTVSSLPDDATEVVFLPSINWPLVEEDVLNAYLGRLATWSATAPQTPARNAARRLIQARDDDWTEPEQLRVIAGVAHAQIPAATDPESLEVLLAITDLARGAAPGPEIESLATTLASSPPSSDPVPYLIGATRLPVEPTTVITISTGLTAWLGAATPTAARQLVIDGRQDLDAIGYDPVSAVVDRWVARNGVEWAALANDCDEGRTPSMLGDGASRATSDPVFVELIDQAFAVVESARDLAAGAELIEAIAGRVATVDFSALGDLGTAIAGLRRLGASTEAVDTALEVRANTEPMLGDYAITVHRLDDAGVPGLRATVVRIAERGSASGGVPIDQIEWIVRVTNGTDAARRVTLRAIESEPVDRVAAILPNLPALRRHPDVRLGAAVRAGSTGTADEARILLDAARGYARPTDPSYQPAIDEVGRRWPDELTDFLNDLN